MVRWLKAVCGVNVAQEILIPLVVLYSITTAVVAGIVILCHRPLVLDLERLNPYH